MAVVTFVVVAILSQCLVTIQGARVPPKDIDGGWSDFRPSGGCRMKRSTNSSMWPGWPSETWPPIVDSSVDVCFFTWQQRMKRSCNNPIPRGKGKRCSGMLRKEVPCECPYKVNPQVDCKLANDDEDSVQAYVSDPCRCSCFYHCHKVDGVWTVPVEPQCCPPCTFWSDVNRACIRVLDGCDDVEKVEEVAKNDTEKESACTLRDDDDKHMFWNGDQQMSCPPNTVFSLVDCGCLLEFDPQIIRDVTCVSFDKGYNNLAATRGVWVRAEKVKVVDGGVKGKCGYFNGSSSLSMPYFSGSFGRYQEFAISFFFKRQAGFTASAGLLSNGDCATKDFSSIVVTSPNSATLRAGFKNTTGTITEQLVGEVSPDGWHYVVISWDGALLTIYVDAQEKYVGSLEGRLAVPNCPITIGVARGLYGYEYFKGYIDEICFYKTSLRKMEIEDMHAKPGKVYYSYYMPADSEE
ncbi:hypothetical protein LSAT2_025193 [Lamellibrachia satsuma]|nr:hypothetical protein LSAT2_025193 [Lamellibrachia satsuma]